MANKRQRLLTPADVKCIELDPDCSRFECLIQVSMVARKIYEEEQLMKEATVEEETKSATCQQPRAVLMIEREESCKKSVSKGERLMIEKSLKKPVNNPLEDMSKEERLKREKKLKKPIIEQNERKRSHSEDSEEEKASANMKMNKNNDKVINIGSTSQPTIPQELINRIHNMNGSSINFVIQKRLYGTDLSRSHNRLSMPLSQVRADFITEGERRSLGLHNGKKWMGLTVLLLEPFGDECEITFKKWDMKKKSGNISSVYLFNGNWYKVCERNKLREGMTVQVWSFRQADGSLGFALIIL